MKIVPVILGGGAGSRLWPMSRQLHPKPFIPLPDGETLIAKTYRRALDISDSGHVVTVTNRELLFASADAYETVGKAAALDSFILEPFGRDTAAAIALATLHVEEVEGRGAIVFVMPSDHLITDIAGFRRSVLEAASLAAEGFIVTIGITPSRPETGYGYIEADGNDVVRFVEKPDLATAQGFVESGRFYWNSGMFCFAAGTMIEAMKHHCPDVLEGARASLRTAGRNTGPTRTTIEIGAKDFENVPAISIDYAVMERVDRMKMVPCGFDWSDIGSWQALSELQPGDAQGNRFGGDVLSTGASGCFVASEDRLVSLVGVTDLVVVDTADALLVAHRDATQDVKHIFNQLKETGHEAAMLHKTVHRPWGSYTVLETGPGFKIKRIVVRPGGRLSLQSHRHRSEHWVVVSGTAKVVNGETEMLLNPNQSTYVPVGQKHRLENPGTEALAMIEVQCGAYLGEDDIERFDDVYGRN